MASSQRTCARVLLLALVAGLLVLFQAPAANAAGTVTGNVKEAGTNANLEYIDIWAWYATGDPEHPWDIYDVAYTDENGDYSLPLPAGSYRVQFVDWSNVHKSEFFANAADLPSATPVVVVEGEATPAVDAVLDKNGGFTGKVTADNGGANLEDIEVTLEEGSDVEGWNTVSYAYTNFEGNYTIYAPDGTYKVCFHDYDELYARECYNNKAPDAAADLQTITGATVTPGINAALADAGRITGKVTADGTGAELEDIEVRLWLNYGTPELPDWDWARAVYTDENGDYAIGGAPGTYRLEFLDSSMAQYAGEFYNNKATVELADDIEIVGVAATTGKNASLAPPAVQNTGLPSITGTAKVGSTLTANPGTWTPPGASFGYQWRVGGNPVASSGPTYTPTAADVGKTVSVVVAASKAGYQSGIAVSAPTAAVAPNAVASTTAVKAKVKGTKVKLTVTVSSSVAATGQVAVYLKKKLLKTVTLSGGKATVKLKKQAAGKNKYKASYLGSPTVLPSSKGIKVIV